MQLLCTMMVSLCIKYFLAQGVGATHDSDATVCKAHPALAELVFVQRHAAALTPRTLEDNSRVTPSANPSLRQRTALGGNSQGSVGNTGGKHHSRTQFPPSDTSSSRSAVDVVDAFFPARTADGVVLKPSLIQGVEILATVVSSKRFNGFFAQLSSNLPQLIDIAENEYGQTGVSAKISTNENGLLMQARVAEGACGGGGGEGGNTGNQPQTFASLQPGSQPASCAVLLCNGLYKVPYQYPWITYDSCVCSGPWSGGGPMHALVQIPKKIIFAHVDKTLTDEGTVVAIDQIAQLAREQTDGSLVLVDELVFDAVQSQLESSDRTKIAIAQQHSVVFMDVCVAQK